MPGYEGGDVCVGLHCGGRRVQEVSAATEQLPGAKQEHLGGHGLSNSTGDE